MALFLAFPLLSALVIFQSAVLSRMPLLQGTPDLVLLTVIGWALQERVHTHWQWSLIGGLMMGYVSGLPFGIFPVGYLLSTGLAVLLRRRLWKAPVLAMLAAAFAGTLVTQALSIGAILFTGAPLPVLEALNLVTLPSLVLNLFLAAPVFALMRDLAKRLYPEVLEV